VKRRKPPVIGAMYAWLVIEPEGEIVCVAEMGNIFLPLISPDRTRIKGFRQRAEMVRKTTGYPVRLVKFAQREVLEEI
jgi:hypothetical protein